MERRYIPIEAFLKPCLVEWIETLLSNNPQHPLLRRIRNKEKISEKDRDSFTCWIINCEYAALMKLFYLEDFLDYVAFVLDVSRADINEVSFGDNTYTRDDFEGAFYEIKERVMQNFGSQGIIPPISLRKRAVRMHDTIRRRIPNALQNIVVDPSSPDELREVLGRCRTDFEELVKHIAHFLSLAAASKDRPAVDFVTLSEMSLSKIIEKFIYASAFDVDPQDNAMLELERLINHLLEKLTDDEVRELSSLSKRFKQELPKRPYRLDALRIFGNIFHHDGVSHAHTVLVRKYVDLADTFLDTLNKLLPKVVCIVGVEHRSDGSVNIRIYDQESDNLMNVLYTSEQIKRKYKAMAGKYIVQESSVERKPESLHVEAFLFPAVYHDDLGKQNSFPIIAERRLVSLSKASLTQFEGETRLRIEVAVQTPVYKTIDTLENVQE